MFRVRSRVRVMVMSRVRVRVVSRVRSRGRVSTSGISRRTPTAKSCGPNLSGLPVIVIPSAPTKLARDPVYLVAAGRMMSIESQAPDPSRSWLGLGLGVGVAV